MYKILNIVLFILILIFFINIYFYYSSKKNVNAKDFNRININKIINEKISNLLILHNDTNDVIEFNNSFSNEKKIKSRSFWNLLKSK
ncbi:hypothetical protein N9L69_00290 [Candidatus Pelagibacter bacterium]|jgi:hypothetical protein|nr:hypothetical protein [Candidatus Pelagibacter bacterium]|tara:strand:- start:2883 stop:3143 length:261 start_codon:yes stop_codon:yes gene_type:complete